MEVVVDILQIIIPSGIVFATAYYFLKTFVDADYKRKREEARSEFQKTLTPIRLQAYERMILLLERIAPENLIMRVLKFNMTSQQLQLELIKSIREEYTHNLSQQLYISDQAWELVKTAKEEMIQLINSSMGRLKDTASARDLSTLIFEATVSREHMPIEKAIHFIKNEMRANF
jgi:hypothetical protein